MLPHMPRIRAKKASYPRANFPNRYIYTYGAERRAPATLVWREEVKRRPEEVCGISDQAQASYVAGFPVPVPLPPGPPVRLDPSSALPAASKQIR